MKKVKLCAICGREAECVHHLIFGYGKRPLADNDGLTLNMCNSCHNFAQKERDRIHGNNMAEVLSKMLGQAIWERNQFAEAYGEDIRDARIMLARNDFIKRYGKSWL